MGGQTVQAGQYLSKPKTALTMPDTSTQWALLAGKQKIGSSAIESAYRDFASMQEDLRAAQEGSLQTKGKILDLYTKTIPLTSDFDAEKTSRQAAELGLSNQARSRQFEQLLSPATARMRLQLPEQIESATSGEAFKNYMDAWLRQKGISAVGGTGVDPSSTFGRSMLADVSTDEGRRRMLEDIALRRGFVDSQEAPAGGIDPGTLMAAQQASEAGNLGAMSDWQRGILQGATQLGSTLDAFQQDRMAMNQTRMGLNQSVFDYLSQNMGEILNLTQKNQAGIQAYQARNEENMRSYEQALYDAAVQNASSRNAMTGQLIGAGAGLAGAGIGAAAIII